MSKNYAPHQSNFNKQNLTGGPTIRKIKLKTRRTCSLAKSIEQSSDDESDDYTIRKNPIEEARTTSELAEECEIRQKLFEDAIKNLKIAIRPKKQKNKISNILNRRTKEEDEINCQKQVEKSVNAVEESFPMPALDQPNTIRNRRDGAESESSWGAESESSWGADSSTESYDETVYSSVLRDSDTKPVTTTAVASRSVYMANPQVCESHSVNYTSIGVSVSGDSSHLMAIKEESLDYAETTPPKEESLDYAETTSPKEESLDYAETTPPQDQPSPHDDLPQTNNRSLPTHITQQDIKIEPADNEAPSQVPPMATQPCYRADVTHSLIEFTALPLDVLSQPVMEVTLTNQCIQTCVQQEPPSDTLSNLTPPPIFTQGAEASDTSGLPSSTATNGVPISVKSLLGSLGTSHKRTGPNQSSLIVTSNSSSNSPAESQASNTEASTVADRREASQPGATIADINIAPSDVPPYMGNVSEQGTSEHTHLESQRETVQSLNRVRVCYEGEAHPQSTADNPEYPPLPPVEGNHVLTPSQPTQEIPVGKPQLQATIVTPVSKALQSTSIKETTVPKPRPHSTDKPVSTTNQVSASPFPDVVSCHSPLLSSPFFASPFNDPKLHQTSFLPLPFRDPIVAPNSLPTNEALPTEPSQPLRQPAYLPNTGYRFVINHYGDVDERVNQIHFNMNQFAPLVSSNDSKPSVDQPEAKPIMLPLKNEMVDAASPEGLSTSTEFISYVGCVERSPKTEDVSQGDPPTHISLQSDDVNIDDNNEENVASLCRPVTVRKSQSFESIKMADGCEGEQVSQIADTCNEVDLCVERSDREVKGKRKKKKRKEVVSEVDCTSEIGSIATEELEGKKIKNSKKKKSMSSKRNCLETMQPSGEDFCIKNKKKKKRKSENSLTLDLVRLTSSPSTVESELSISKKKKRHGTMSLEANNFKELMAGVKLDTETHERRKKKSKERSMDCSEQSFEMVSSTVDLQLKLGVVYETKKKKHKKTIKSILLHGIQARESLDNVETDVIKIKTKKNKGNKVLSSEQSSSLKNCQVDFDCSSRTVQDTFNVNELQKQKKNKKGKSKKSYSLGKTSLETVFESSEAKGGILNEQIIPKKKKKHKKDKLLNNSDWVEPKCMKEPQKCFQPEGEICDENTLPKKKKNKRGNDLNLPVDVMPDTKKKKKRGNDFNLPVDVMLDTKKKKNKESKKKESEPHETVKCEKKKKKKCKMIDPLESFVMAASDSNVQSTHKRKFKDKVNALAEADSSARSKSCQSIEEHSDVSCSKSKRHKLLRVDRIEPCTKIDDVKRKKRKKHKL